MGHHLVISSGQKLTIHASVYRRYDANGANATPSWKCEANKPAVSSQFSPWGPALCWIFTRTCKWREAEHETDVRKITLFYENPGSAPSAFFIHPHGTLLNIYRWRFQHFESPIRFSCHQKRFSTSLFCNAALILSSILKRITRKNREEQSKTWHKLNRLLGINVKCYVSCLRNLLTMTIFLKLRDGRSIYLYIESRA